MRTSEGRERAKPRGVKLGRKPKLTDHQRREAIKRRDRGETTADIARSYNDPATEAPFILAPDGPRVAVKRPPYVYALCWSDAEFHMVGPFGSTDALERYIQIACDYDPKRPDNDSSAFGPHGDDLRWYAVVLQMPAGPSRVDPPPPASEIPTKPTRKFSKRHMRMCHRAAVMHEVMERAVDTHLTQTRRH